MKEKRTRRRKLVYGHRIKQALLGLVLLLLLFTLYSFYQSNYTFRTVEYTAESPNLPNSFNDYKIAQISDLHNSIYEEKLLEKVEEADPDIVVITGDSFSKDNESTEDVIRFIEELSEQYQTYLILGNHELWTSDEKREEFIEAIEKTDVVFLENKAVPIIRQGKKIYVYGLLEDEGYYGAEQYGENIPVTHYLGPKPKDYTVLLAHNPYYWEDYLQWGADLTLSGHIHGGGIRLPGLGGVFSPAGYLFPERDRGIFREGDKTLVISAGLGNSGTPFRLFNPPELVIITLKSLSIY